jgi:hypothetical protein
MPIPGGYLDRVHPSKNSRALCRCGWTSPPCPTPRAARDAYETHYAIAHEEAL